MKGEDGGLGMGIEISPEDPIPGMHDGLSFSMFWFIVFPPSCNTLSLALSDKKRVVY